MAGDENIRNAETPPSETLPTLPDDVAQRVRLARRLLCFAGVLAIPMFVYVAAENVFGIQAPRSVDNVLGPITGVFIAVAIALAIVAMKFVNTREVQWRYQAWKRECRAFRRRNS